MIPKIIHYCWLSGEEYPKHIEENIASWKAILPEYEFILWDTSQFDVSKSEWVQQAFDNKKFAFASDFIRMFALYNFGGIYLDIDVEILKSFDDLLNLPYFIGSQHNSQVEAAIIGSEKRAEWILNCMRYYENRSFINEDGSFDMQVLPSIIESQVKNTRILRKMSNDEAKIPHMLPEDEAVFYLFPFEYFCAKNYETGKISISDNTYTIHHFNSSWLPFLSKIRRRLIRTIGVQKAEGLIDLVGMRKIAKILRVPSTKYRLYK